MIGATKLNVFGDLTHHSIGIPFAHALSTQRNIVTFFKSKQFSCVPHSDSPDMSRAYDK